MRAHIYDQLDEMDRILLTCSEEAQADTGPKLKELRNIYDAYFDTVDIKNFSVDEEKIPAHVKRAHAIIMTLEDDDDAALPLAPLKLPRLNSATFAAQETESAERSCTSSHEPQATYAPGPGIRNPICIGR